MRVRSIIFLLFIGVNCAAQVSVEGDTSIVNGDTTVLRSLTPNAPVTEISMAVPEHSPTRAALLSAIIPGFGQIYNKKYWKVPIVWGGLATFGYFIHWNNEQYQYYRTYLSYEVADDPDYPNDTGLDKSSLVSARDYYRRNRDNLALYGILFYLIQIVDAHVDAHLIEFDVNQDLSVKLEPNYIPMDLGGNNLGLSIKFRF